MQRLVRAQTKELFAAGDGTYLEAVENNVNLIGFIGVDEIAFTAGSDHLDLGKPQYAVIPA
jgi:hypothetical protein